MQRDLSPTHLAASVLEDELKRVGVSVEGLMEAEEDAQCAMCGVSIQDGEKCSPWKIPQKFNDTNELANRNSSVICSCCRALIGTEYLRYGGNAVIAESGAFNLNKYAAMAYVLENPPEPPFVMTRRTGNSQHVIWRTPVSLSRDYYFFRLGLSLFSIRRQAILNGRKAIQRLRELMGDTGMNVGKAKMPCFVNFDLELNDPRHGRLRDDVLALGDESKEAHDCIDVIKELKPGELWATGVITMFEGDPELLVPLTLSKQS